MTSKGWVLAAAVALAAPFSGTAHAGIFAFSQPNAGNGLQINGAVSIGVDRSGTVRYDESHDALNPSYYADYCPLNCVPSFNNWFSFDISGLAGTTVEEAVFNVYSYTVYEPAVYGLFDFDAPLRVLTNPAPFARRGTYADLGSGSLYGWTNVERSNEFQSIELTPSAVADLNAAIAAGRRNFIIGGTIAPFTVASPGSGLLAVTAVGLLAAVRRRVG